MPKFRKRWLTDPETARDVFKVWISKTRKPPGVNEAGEAIQEEGLEVLQLDRALLLSRQEALGVLRRCFTKGLLKARRHGRTLWISLA